MKELIPCPHCDKSISDTAIVCPRCLKETGSPKSTEFLALLGNVLILPAISGIFNFSAIREEKKLAKKVDAIDRIELDDDWFVLVSEKHFAISCTSFGECSSTSILRSDLKDASIDELKSKKKSILRKESTALRLDYFDTYRLKKDVSEVYKFKGDHSLSRANIALEKIKEYMEDQRLKSK